MQKNTIFNYVALILVPTVWWQIHCICVANYMYKCRRYLGVVDVFYTKITVSEQLFKFVI